MKKLFYNSPDGLRIIMNDLEELKINVLFKFPQYWQKGNGEGILEWYNDEKLIYSLLIFPNDNYGIYLFYIDNINFKEQQIWLSLEDDRKLGDLKAEYSYECYASIGLFLPIDKAWIAIEEFCKTGLRAKNINWIKEEEMPEDSHY